MRLCQRCGYSESEFFFGCTLDSPAKRNPWSALLLTERVVGRSRQELVEDVEVPLPSRLLHHP